MSIDKHIAAESFTEALNSIDSLYEYTNDDLLQLQKGHIYDAADNILEAEKSYAFVVENYPLLIEGYSFLLALYDTQNKVDEAVKVLHTLEENIDLDYDLVEELFPELIPNICKTELYNTWLKEARIRDTEKY